MYLSISRFCACALIALAVPVALGAPVVARTEVEVTCTACLLVDDTGRELFARKASVLLPNASTTKMTTALVVQAETDPSEPVMVSAGAAGIGGGGLDLSAGQVFSVEALLHALLLDSSNDAAVALAEHVAGSHEEFVGAMNDLAADLGARDTNFVTAHGLDMPGHGSSARDLALIAEEVLADDLLAEIVGTAHARIEGPRGAIALENRNLLLEGYAGATGVKTGFTAGAGNVLVASAERDGRRLIAVVMHSVDAAADARALLDLGWTKLARTVVLPRGTSVGALVFDTGSTKVISAQPVRDATRPDRVTFRFDPFEDLRMPLAPGDVVGDVVVTSDRGEVDNVEAIAAGAVGIEDRSWASDAFAGLLGAVGRLVGSSL